MDYTLRLCAKYKADRLDRHGATERRRHKKVEWSLWLNVLPFDKKSYKPQVLVQVSWRSRDMNMLKKGGGGVTDTQTDRQAKPSIELLAAAKKKSFLWQGLDFWLTSSTFSPWLPCLTSTQMMPPYSQASLCPQALVISRNFQSRTPYIFGKKTTKVVQRLYIKIRGLISIALSRCKYAF